MNLPEAAPQAPTSGVGIQAADGTYPFQGLWNSGGADCAEAPGSTPMAPIEITPAGFVGYENACAIDSVTVLEPDARFVLGMSCEGEGEAYMRDVTLTVSPEEMLAEEEGGELTVFVRCEATE